jgi:hypothetical protein
LHAIAGHNQHVAVLGQIRFVAQRAMPRNDLGVVVGQGKNFIGGENHAVDFPAGAGVDERVKAVKKRFAHVNHVGLLEVSVDVRVGMRRLEILQHHDFTVGLQFLAGAECLLRQSIRRGCRKVQTEKRTVVWLSARFRDLWYEAVWCTTLKRTMGAPMLPPSRESQFLLHI